MLEVNYYRVENPTKEYMNLIRVASNLKARSGCSANWEEGDIFMPATPLPDIEDLWRSMGSRIMLLEGDRVPQGAYAEVCQSRLYFSTRMPEGVPTKNLITNVVFRAFCPGCMEYSDTTVYVDPVLRSKDIEFIRVPFAFSCHPDNMYIVGMFTPLIIN